MPLKITLQKETHIYNGTLDFDQITQYVRNSFQKAPLDFYMYYIDSDGDQIVVNCQQDLQVLEAMSSKTTKLFVESQQQIDKIPQAILPNSQETSFQNFVEELKQVNSQEPEKPLKKKKTSLKERRKEKFIENFEEEMQKYMPKIIDEVRISLGHSPIQSQISQKQQGTFSLKKTAQKSQPKAIHKGYICDGCEQGPILGARYKCAICEDFDFCETCEASKEHNHPFLKIKTPAMAPKVIIAALDDDLQQLQQNLQTVPLVKQIVDSKIQKPQVEKHVFEDLVVPVPPKKTKISKKKKASVHPPKVTNKSNQVAQVMQGKPEDYIQLVLDNQHLSAQDLIENLIAIQQMEYKEKSEEVTKQPNGDSQVTDVSTDAEFQVIEDKKEEKPKKQYSVVIRVKAEKIKEIFGGNLDEICEFLSQFEFITIEEAIEKLMEKSQKPKQTPGSTTTTPEQPKEAPKKELIKEFNQQAKDRASIIQGILGGVVENYYGMVDTLCFSDVNEIIDMLLNDPTLLEKYPSFK